ncbi:MAG TPA: hypothetical protein PKB14_07785 [Rubrivivax sp.]|nr:hypothetical protein [Rubrivivax sp.]
MSAELTEAERQTMRKRWARRRAAQMAKPVPELGPADLHRLLIEASRHKVAVALAQVEYKRRTAAEADAADEHGIAQTLRLLATTTEVQAALEVASRRESERGFARWRRTERNRLQARRPRPGARRPIRDAILLTLAPLKREGVEFRTLMRRWRAERIGSLRLVGLGDGRRFRVVDENGEASDAAVYTRGTLQRLYSESQRVLTASAGWR